MSYSPAQTPPGPRLPRCSNSNSASGAWSDCQDSRHCLVSWHPGRERRVVVNQADRSGPKSRRQSTLGRGRRRRGRRTRPGRSNRRAAHSSDGRQAGRSGGVGQAVRVGGEDGPGLRGSATTSPAVEGLGELAGQVVGGGGLAPVDYRRHAGALPPSESLARPYSDLGMARIPTRGEYREGFATSSDNTSTTQPTKGPG